MKKKIAFVFCAMLLVIAALGLVACNKECKHTWSSDWQSDSTHHWHSCTKKDCDEINGKEEHKFEFAKDNMHHWGKCVICGYDLAKQEHTFKIKNDGSYHWNECLQCGYSTAKTEHTFKDGKCTYCGYLLGTKQLEYELNADSNSYSVVGLNIDNDDIVSDIIIPEYYQDKPVTVIASDAFNSIANIKSIMLSNKITTIESGAFAYCVAISEIVIPESVVTIEQNVFEGCNGITIKAETKNKPAGWNTEDWQVSGHNYSLPIVWDCKNNDKAENGYNYVSITYENNEKIKYTIKDGVALVARQPKTSQVYNLRANIEYKGNVVKVIGVEDFAFYNFEELSAIDIPATFVTIGDYAFAGCTSLNEINWRENHEDDIQISIGLCAFMDDIKLTQLILPNKLAQIKAYAFAGCNTFEEINIPSTVTYIGQNAFEFCGRLIIRCEAQSAPASWDEKWNAEENPVIWDCNNNSGNLGNGKVIYEQNNGIAVYMLDTNTKTATLLRQTIWDTNVEIASVITYPNVGGEVYTVNEIGANAFFGDASITSITISENITKIGAYAFANCSNVTKVVFNGDKITSIGNNAFAGCGNLDRIEFNGTKDKWDLIEKGDKWDNLTAQYTVYFSDGSSISKK